MKEKELILEDAIRTAIEQNRIIIVQKVVIACLGCLSLALSFALYRKKV